MSRRGLECTWLPLLSLPPTSGRCEMLTVHSAGQAAQLCRGAPVQRVVTFVLS